MDALKTQNGRKRTGTHIKTDANAMYGLECCLVRRLCRVTQVRTHGGWGVQRPL